MSQSELQIAAAAWRGDVRIALVRDPWDLGGMLKMTFVCGDGPRAMRHSAQVVFQERSK